ncbi:hypothetical protein [Bordetella tumbae]|uniref:hypothetical protein n=1 Tax=Bordetella tumbae TaxID=1649139 RepID=UPI0039F11C87
MFDVLSACGIGRVVAGRFGLGLAIEGRPDNAGTDAQTNGGAAHSPGRDNGVTVVS